MELKDIRKPQKLYDMHEVSKFMGVSYITLYRMVKSGKISYVNIAKTGKKEIFNFRAEDVQAYYDQAEKSKAPLGERNPKGNS